MFVTINTSNNNEKHSPPSENEYSILYTHYSLCWTAAAAAAAGDAPCTPEMKVAYYYQMICICEVLF